ncbi:hypothetical protein PMIN03_000193 [Paraphaeosphaeria minitans]
MEENTRANKAKCKNGGLGSEDPAKKHQLAAVSDAITRTQTQEDSDIRADQKPSLSKPPSMERDGLTSSTAQLHGGARSPGSPLSTATRTTGLLAGGPVHAPDSLGNLCGLEQISKFAGLGVASHVDISTGVCSTSANGDSEFSWTLPHSNATTSLAPTQEYGLDCTRRTSAPPHFALVQSYKRRPFHYPSLPERSDTRGRTDALPLLGSAQGNAPHGVRLLDVRGKHQNMSQHNDTNTADVPPSSSLRDGNVVQGRPVTAWTVPHLPLHLRRGRRSCATPLMDRRSYASYFLQEIWRLSALPECGGNDHGQVCV